MAQTMEPDMIRFVMNPMNGGAECTSTVRKSLVTSASKIFMEQMESLPDSCKEIVFKKCSPEAFMTVMEYLGGSEVTLNDVEFVMEVFHLSDFYQISSLRDLCLNCMKIEVAVAVHIYERAVELNISEVQRACLEVFKSESVDIITSTGFDQAKPSTIQTILDHCKHLGYLRTTALVKWSFHECNRKCISRTPKNVESCVSGLCEMEWLRKIRGMVRSFCDLGLSEFDLSEFSQILNEIILDNFRIAAISEPDESGQAINILLKDILRSGSDKSQSAFKSDIICKLKVSLLEGDIDLTGMVLQLKAKTSSPPKRVVLEELLEVFYRIDRHSDKPFQFDDQVEWFSGQYLEIHLENSLRISKGESFEIGIRIEDLEPYRCLNANGKYHEVFDSVKGICFSLDISCNVMKEDENTVPFFIQKLLYNAVPVERI